MKEIELKGKCSNCGKPIKEESNHNWKVYCPAPECFKKAFEEATKKT